ncbi:MAG: hypothetical protein AB7O26_07420, partial [Planctomycetaceae bacterium]
CMAFDEDLLQTRRIKPALLGMIADKGWLGLSDHDPDHAAVRIRRDDRQEFVVTESIVALEVRSFARSPAERGFRISGPVQRTCPRGIAWAC